MGSGITTIVSYLQFADDTLIIAEKSWANVRTMRAILMLFEAISGLKANFTKSQLFVFNVHFAWLTEAALVLKCKVGSLPFVYLGLPIGGDARQLSFWDPLITRLKSRLFGWKSKHLSFGGRLVLLKSVLSSMHVYALSFFKAPSGIISFIESILNYFFWVGNDNQKKNSWVDWNSVCLSKEVGGLGVRRIREFNNALLGKWCWRLLVEKECLWYRVLSARYGEEGGRLLDGGGSASAWWRVIAALRNEVWFGGEWEKHLFLVGCVGGWGVF